MRRLITPLGALLSVAALSTLSSCSTFDRHDVAATVNGHELTFEQLDVLSDGSTSASLQRQTLSNWIRIAAPTEGPLDITSTDQFDAAWQTMLESIAPADGAAKDAYEQGVNVSEVVCLMAFQIETATDADAVLAEIDDAESFAATATEFSISQDHVEGCATTSSLAFIAELSEADPAVGDAVLIEVAGTTPASRLIVRITPYSELSDADRLEVDRSSVTEIVVDIVTKADVYVNPRLGRWDAATATVVADEG